MMVSASFWNFDYVAFNVHVHVFVMLYMFIMALSSHTLSLPPSSSPSSLSLSLLFQVIAKSLQSMLDYEGTDESFQDTFMATFSITYSDMFVSVQSANLKEEGDKIPVTLDNRQVSTCTWKLLVLYCTDIIIQKGDTCKLHYNYMYMCMCRYYTQVPVNLNFWMYDSPVRWICLIVTCVNTVY